MRQLHKTSLNTRQIDCTCHPAKDTFQEGIKMLTVHQRHSPRTSLGVLSAFMTAARAYVTNVSVTS